MYPADILISPSPQASSQDDHPQTKPTKSTPTTETPKKHPLAKLTHPPTTMSESSELMVNFDLRKVFIFHAVFGVPERPESTTRDFFFQSVFVPLEGGYTGAVALLVSMIYKIKDHPRQIRLRYDTSPEHTGGVWYGLWLDKELEAATNDCVRAAIVEDMERMIGKFVTGYNASSSSSSSPPTSPTVREV
ncbi:hypothetical protein P168DRAFT_286083 [Aspergillus campestris IBT 28561]|uniref:Uncharacterized protein n=1 Tax=Aspergillus campestris (strain IBT 28561) TaxID=1392248 RepID=A0A2I1DDI6_ASPC2|nr:uncharacterized protein P168DRAFT_286083 [Aspergillus campestris IBT 28561]PKY07910.1 hypothetical protein P168DRAFT_286083 [Aspergillus campestris IBT 28561]